MWYVPAVLEHDETRRRHQLGQLDRPFQRDRIVTTVEDQRGYTELAQLALELRSIMPQARPGRLLCLRLDEEWRGVVRVLGISEVPCDAEIEPALPIGGRITLLEL